jgi:hypothetical protein
VTIAFIAVYCILTLGKKVHILENNEGLLAKDYAQFEEFYRKYFSICVAKADNRTPGAPNDQDPLLIDAQVIYMTSRAMQTMYAHGVGRNPCTGVVLIVDEVDDLIVDKAPNDVYGIPHDKKSEEMRFCIDALNSGMTERPSLVSDTTWIECTAQYKLASRKVLNVHYTSKEGPEGEHVLAQVCA